MPKKKKVEPQGSFAGSLILGVLVAAIGVALGMFSLAVEKVDEVRQMPKEEEIKKRTVYFVSGKDRGGSYRVKEEAFLSGKPGMLKLTEADLNAWAGNTFKFVRPANEEDTGGGFASLKPSAPNFRIQDGVFQIGIAVNVDSMFLNDKMRYFAKGGFDRQGDAFVFVPAVSYLGSAKLPMGVESVFGASLLAVFEQNEAFARYAEAWKGLSEVRVEGDELILIRQ